MAKSFLRYLFYCVLAMVLLLLIANMFGNIESAFDSWPKFLEFLNGTLRSVPAIVEIILPLSVLLATVMTFTGLSRSSELVAMKSAGMGFLHMMLPLFLVLVPVAALGYLNQNYLYNALNREEDQAAGRLERHQWRSDGKNIYYFSSIDSQSKSISKGYVFRWLPHPFRISEMVTFSAATRERPGWTFQHVTKREHSAGAWKFERTGTLNVPEREFPNVFKPLEVDAHHMPIIDLYREIRQLEKRNPRVVVYLSEWYQKTAVLFAPFIMVLVGAPLSQSHVRRARVAGEIVVTIFGGIVYWIGNEILLTLGQGGVIHPLIAAWGVNVLFIAVGLALFLRHR